MSSAVYKIKSLDYIQENKVNTGYRDGVPIEKGVVVTEDWMIKNQSLVEKYMDFFITYPDLYLDIIKPEDSKFSLFFFQRIVLRALMRYQEIYVVGPRAFSKSFISILAIILQCIFIPGCKRFICAPNKNQSAQIAKEKIMEIYDKFPLIQNEIKPNPQSNIPGSFGKDSVELKFKNGSIFNVVGALDSTRGGRRHGGLIDEVRDHDEEPLNNIVLPLMNISRQLPDGTINPKEPNQQTIYMTSAGSKMSFSYSKLIEAFENSVISPENSFVMTCDYRVPMLHGLLNKQFVNKLKMAPSFREDSFAREYLSIWGGATDNSWFNFDKLQKHRKIKNPETYGKIKEGTQHFYLLSVDVGRLKDQTVCCVFKVQPKDYKYYAKLVNLYVLGLTPETKPFNVQVRDLKRIIKKFNPREVVMDTNGLGIGLADLVIQEQVDDDGEILPAYGFINDDAYKKIQPKNAKPLFYGIKANASLNSKIHSNTYSRINSGLVKLLIREQEAKSYLMATKKGQKMSVEERIKRLMPHEMTTRLLEEMSNLQLKKTNSSTDIILERINERFPKDKYSAFSYGLWRIKELEDEGYKRKKKYSTGTTRQLMFYS